MAHNDDMALVGRMLRGQQPAFDEFFNAYFDRLFRFAMTRLDHDEAAAEDAVQQALTRAVQRLEQYRGDAALFTWLCTICRNSIADSFRAKDRPRGQPVPFEDTPEIRAALESLTDVPAHDPQRELLNEQIRRVVQAILDHLPQRYADVLDWKYIQGLSVKEISERLHVAPKAAESLLGRARIAFREGFAAVGSIGELT